MRADRSPDPRSRIATRTAESLADALSRLRLEGLPKGGATRLLTRATIEWAESLHWLPVTEMPLAFLEDTPEAPGRQGIVDLYIARPGYTRDLVVEIDRGNKSWSAVKLGHAVAHGRAAIWVRWSGQGPSDGIVPAGVEVIYVAVGRAPRVREARPPVDPRLVEPGAKLSASSRALLAALYPAGPPEADDVWADEELIWARVAKLDERLALILRCRFGRWLGRAQTLRQTAEVVAEQLNTPAVSRERIRQLQAKAVRQLRLKSRSHVRALERQAAPSSSPPTKASPKANLMAVDEPSAQLAANPEFVEQVLALLRAAGPEPLKATMISHVLRGSKGPMTRELVERHALPHYGDWESVPYRVVRDAVRALAQRPPFSYADDYLSVGGEDKPT